MNSVKVAVFIGLISREKAIVDKNCLDLRNVPNNYVLV